MTATADQRETLPAPMPRPFLAWSLAALVLVSGAGVTRAQHAKPQETVYAKSVSSKLNPTGRALTMPVPLKDDKQSLGDVVIRINPDDSVLIPKGPLIDRLTPVLDQTALVRLQAVPDSNGLVSIADLRAAGLNISFDSSLFELAFSAGADQRPVGDLSIGHRAGGGISANAARPAILSGYLNVITGFDHRWSDVTSDSATSGRIDLQSVFRFYNVVLENEFAYDGRIDTFQCPTGAICNYSHTAGLERQRSRIVYDMPDQQLRLQVGDADTIGTSFQRQPDVLGVTLEKSPRKLRPGESIRPTGRSSFRIERPSDVEVLVNGAIVQRFRLRAGSYNLSDLPLATGANDVQLVITDDAGERRTIAFTTFFDGSLLGAGKSEWSLSGGTPSYLKDNERMYRTDEVFGTGFYRYGISDRVTGEAHLQADRDVVMSGLGVFSMTPWGLFGLQGAASQGPRSSGVAANANWDIINFHGPFATFGALREAFRFGVEYRSTEFRAPGEFLTTASGILYPQFNYWLRLNAAYTVPFGNGLAATLSGRYQFANENAMDLSPYTLKGDRFGADLTLSKALSPTTSGSLTVGYSNESYLFADTRAHDQADFRVVARVYWRPTDSTRIATSYDSLNGDAYVSAHTQAGRGVDRWDASVDVNTNSRTDQSKATATAGYYGNRMDVRVLHTGGVDGLGGRPNHQDQRSAIRLGTSIAFADDVVAVGAPIRGNGFAIVKPHETIAGKTVTVGSSEDVRARTDLLGPALVTDVPAYTNASIPVDVEDLPLGYSLGAGTFDTQAPYRGGYKLEVGSAYSVTAFGMLLLADGSPVSLLSGTAHPANDPKKQVSVFTNASGKFSADGLAPGRWIIEMATDGPPQRYVIDVPKGTQGLYQVGTLRPVGKS